MATEPKPAAVKKLYMVNRTLVVGTETYSKGDRIELTDDELQALGIGGSGVLSRMRTAAEQKAHDEAQAQAAKKASADAANKPA